jgi:hypothetical protein
MKVLSRSELVLGLALALALALGLFAIGCDSMGRLEITTTSLKDGKVGQAYADTIKTRGGDEGVEVTVVSGQLPPGLAFRGLDDDAELYGTPTLAGQYLFTVAARDYLRDPGFSEVVSRGFVITIQP